ncbi:MAG: hypothetical protein AB1Z67_09540 [Candidatus Limnocylindrales bacterium]
MRLVTDWLLRLDPRWTVLILAISIAMVGVSGVLTAWLAPDHPWFDLDSEIGLGWPPTEITIALPSLWATLLLCFAGLCWIAVGWGRSSTGDRTAGLLFGLTLAFFAFDEQFSVHERLESRLGLDWQLLYLPVAAFSAGLVLYWTVRVRRSVTTAAWMLLLATACWALAALLEYVQWRGDEQVDVYVLFMIPEELLELTGSSIFALAGLRVLRRDHAGWAARAGTRRSGSAAPTSSGTARGSDA